MINRRRVAAACAAGAFLLLAPLTGCGSDDSADVVDDDAATTTTAAGDGEPIAGRDDSTTTTEDESATTTEDDGDEPLAGSDDEIEADEGEGDPWALDAAAYRSQDGQRVAYRCPAEGTIGSVWGTDTYTDDSSVCSAAVHAGLITLEEGGRVVIEIAPAEESYQGSEAHGVDSSDYGAWGGSFTFPPS